jgi:hypothetical protein
MQIVNYDLIFFALDLIRVFHSRFVFYIRVNIFPVIWDSGIIIPTARNWRFWKDAKYLSITRFI